jgi:hypothetical protein
MYYIERFLVDSRVEHLRQYERMKVADHSIQEHALAFHIDKRPPISRILLQVLSKAIAREGWWWQQYLENYQDKTITSNSISIHNLKAAII